MTPLTAAMLLTLTTADLSGDRYIGGSDIAMLLGHWGEPGPVADLNADGHVDAADIASMLTAWGWAWSTADTGDGRVWGAKGSVWVQSPFAGYRRLMAHNRTSIDERTTP